MQLETIAVLRGGPSSEHSVSLETGLGVLAALQDRGYKTRDIVVTKRGEWLYDGYVRQPEQALYGVDVVFIALHGAYGEDGTVQRLLDRLAVPYTGSGAYASSVAMHKQLTKEHVRGLTLKTPRYMRLRRHAVSNIRATADAIQVLFGPEYVVKPTAGGSSIATNLVRVGDSLTDAIATAFTESDDLLVEERISGTEATVGVLEHFRGRALYDLPVIEIVPPENSTFFSHEAKYSGQSDEICPGRFARSTKAALADAARRVHQTLGLRHYSRSDFIVRGDDIYFLEVNTLPGLTPNSLFPKAMDAVGSTYPELVEHLVKRAHTRV